LIYRTLFRASSIAAAAGTLLAAGTASAAGHAPRQAPAPGQWRQVRANGLENFADIGLVRGLDGVLHVLWKSGSTGQSMCSHC
jgi:hypothetical protein